jgi:hypothetical protein
MIMDNHISTTVLHQAITSKAKIDGRASVIQTILDLEPEAATIKNGYGSLPLHVISQRNTKMDSQTKEHLMNKLVKVFPEALLQEGGVGKRTPLHIAFTDYISPHLGRMMISAGSDATFHKDKKGWLPVHVAVSRHCSPEKLWMLLEANPRSLYDLTDKGESLLCLAKTTATKSHPNFRLISELEKKLGITKPLDEEKKEDEDVMMRYPAQRRPTRKRKAEAADLLLHFSRHHGEETTEQVYYPRPVYHQPKYPMKQAAYYQHPRPPKQEYMEQQPHQFPVVKHEYMMPVYYPTQPMYYTTNDAVVGEIAQV